MSLPPPLDEQDPSLTSAPGATMPPARPRYLVVALLVALLFGAGCWMEGCGRLAFYKSDVDLGAVQNAQLTDEQDKARADELYQRFVDASNEQKGRAIPLAAATFVLGAALLAFASRSMSGRVNARRWIVQLVAAQAVVVGATFFATREMQRAELEWQTERSFLLKRESAPNEDLAPLLPQMRAVIRLAPPTWLILRTLASGLVILALTRPRARAFFDRAEAAAATE